MVDKNWWESYFRKGWEPIQHLSRTPYITKKEANFVEYIMKRMGYKSVLDVPCGSGRIALELAKRGYNTCGLEYNPDAIATAINKAEKQKLQHKTRFMVGDMRQMEFKEEFDMAVCIFNSFGYFDDADNLRFLQCVAQALKPGGSFLLDCHILETVLPVWNENGVWYLDDLILLEEREWDLKNSRMNGRWTFIHPNQLPQFFDSSVRVYGFRELKNIMTQLGFTKSKVFSSFEGHKLHVGRSSGAVMLFKKD